MKQPKMKICVIGPEPPPNGGMAMQCQLLRNCLKKDGLQVEFCPVNFKLKPFFLNRIKVFRAVMRFFWYFIKLQRKLSQVQVVHILANSGWSWHLYVSPAIVMAKLNSCHIIINYRGGGADQFFSKSGQWVFPFIRKADEIIVPSHFLKEVFNKHGFEAQIVPNILPDEFLKQDKAQQGKQAKTKFKFIVTRNLESIYGIHNIIQAMALLREEFNEFELHVAGSGPQLPTLKQLCDTLQINDHIVFCGRLSRQDMQKLYESADVMINASTVDNMPNALLEALAQGVPIVTTDVGGIPFMVEHLETALMVEPQNPKAIKDALLQLIYNPELRQSLQDKGRASVQQYTWQYIGPQWKSYYEKGAVA